VSLARRSGGASPTRTEGDCPLSQRLLAGLAVERLVRRPPPSPVMVSRGSRARRVLDEFAFSFTIAATGDSYEAKPGIATLGPGAAHRGGLVRCRSPAPCLFPLVESPAVIP